MNGILTEHHENLDNITSDEEPCRLPPLPPPQYDSLTNGHSSTSEGPPAKKRRLAENIPPPRSSSRHVSPPWKKPGVEGPASFVEGGRRKSSRTNAVPLELQPQQRQTRAAFHKTAQTKGRFGRASLNGVPPSAPSGLSESNGRRPDSASKIILQPYGKSFLKANHVSPTTKYSTSNHQAHSSPLKSPSRVRFHRHSSPSKPTSPSMTPRHLKSSRLTPSSTSHPTDSWLNGVGHSDDEIGEITPRGTRRRLKLRVKEPTVSIQHPQHIVPKRLFSSLRDWLDSEWTGDINGHFSLTDEQAREKGRDRLRVLESGKPGGLLSEEKCSVFGPDAQDEPQQQYGHQDHLVAHALNFRSLMQKERNNHARLRRNLNQIAIAAWKIKQPKTAEDIIQEQQENNRKNYSDVVKDVRHLWEAVSREVERRRMVQWQEQEKSLGKQRLHRIIEYSDKLIGPRAEMLALDSNADTAEEDEDSSMEEAEDGASLDDDDDSNMSSSDAESRSGDGLEPDDVDAALSTEELRRKYGDIPSDDEGGAISLRDQTEADNDTNVNSREHSSTPNEKDGNYELVAPLLGQFPTDIEEDGSDGEHLEETPQEASIVQVDEVDDALLDATDESTDMDDDMGASDQDRDSDESSSDEDEATSDEGDDRGLLGFFSKSAWTTSAPDSPKDATAEFDNPTEGDDDPRLPVLPAPGAPLSVPARIELGDEYIAEDTPADDMEEINNDTAIPPTPTRLSPLNDATEASEDTAPTSPSDDVKTHDVDAMPSLESRAAQAASPISPSLNSSLCTPVPSLLRGTLREYQHYGLDWLAGLYSKNINGILADEMGLGKTIQSIALLAHVAVEHHAWGPHLIVVPTSVMLNWEMEFKKWCPGFKILTYYGTQEERKRKRQGWMDDNSWHVCITSYQLVLQDQQTFKRRNWHYMILDEAHNIKNFKSQRWQTLLNFKTRARLLLTGTPLQNNITEIWSLMAFINPPKEKVSRPAGDEGGGHEGFTDLQSWSDFFKAPVNQIMENGRQELDEDGKKLVLKMHTILRPYLLRRMKADVEKQMPAKYEHVVSCRLSKRQRILYDGYMALTKTRETLASGNYLSIINTLMQLRKVCNHPDLFETRSVTTSFAMPKSAIADFEIKNFLLRRRLQNDVSEMVNLDLLNLVPISRENVSALDAFQSSKIHAYRPLQSLRERQYKRTNWSMHFDGSSMNASLTSLDNLGRKARMRELERTLYLESLRHRREPLYGSSLIERLTLDLPALPKRKPQRRAALLEWHTTQSSTLRDLVPTVMERSTTLTPLVEKFMCLTPAVVAPRMNDAALTEIGTRVIRQGKSLLPADPFHEARMRSSIAFPDKRLLQYDCGKLQRLDKLLRDLQTGGHRALIFTQMTKVLDILEQFLNIHGHRYLRLDGSTKVEQRQALTERFNNDNRILAFILSSRSGGLGINLTGADTVIFYDLDWNPAMDKQCQDRCHRIGQTREVHIYRFVSEYTIESNILRKANQKRILDDIIIQDGEFTTDYLNKLGDRETIGDELLDGDAEANAAMDRVLGGATTNTRLLEAAEEREDAVAAKQAEREAEHADDGDFEEKSVSQSGVGTPKTPLPLTPRDIVAGALTNPPTPIEMGEDAVEASTSLDAVQSGLVDPGHNPGVTRAEDEDRRGHFDNYLLELVKWTLRDVPIAPPIDRSKKKAKKGQEHRITRVR